ncbi:MAG: hypothetical protein QM610_13610 [Chitinophagaceae bacterium]
MKKTLLATALAAVMLSVSCKKSADTGPSIIGQWTLIESKNAMTGVITYELGKGGTVEFTSDSYTFKYPTGTGFSVGKYGIEKVSLDTAMAYSGTSFIQKAGTIYGIKNAGDNQFAMFFYFEESTLVLVRGYYPTDGGSINKYVRLQATTAAE